jgi:hypothetical protein
MEHYYTHLQDTCNQIVRYEMCSEGEDKSS